MISCNTYSYSPTPKFLIHPIKQRWEKNYDTKTDFYPMTYIHKPLTTLVYTVASVIKEHVISDRN